MDELKGLFNSLQVDNKSVLFVQNQINDKLLKKLKKSKYKKEKELVSSFNLLVDKKTDFNKKDDGRYSIPIKAEYIQKTTILIVLLYLAYKHRLIFCMLMLLIYAF